VPAAALRGGMSVRSKLCDAIGAGRICAIAASSRIAISTEMPPSCGGADAFDRCRPASSVVTAADLQCWHVPHGHLSPAPRRNPIRRRNACY
jgi:hypothetical protein